MSPPHRLPSRLKSAAILTVLCSVPAFADDAPPDPLASASTLEREPLVGAVLERNPSIAAAEAAWQAARTQSRQAGALADPSLDFSLAPLSVGSPHGFGYEVQVSQAFPFPGKQRLRGEIADREASAAREDLSAVRLDLAVAASSLFDDYYLLHRALEVNHHHREVLTALKKSADAQYVAGRTGPSDPLQVEVELADMVRERIALEAERDRVRARINGLLHRDARATLPPPPATLPTPELEPKSAEALEREALLQRPELKGIRARLDSTSAGTELAKREWLPDLMVMAAYNSMWPETPHRFMAGVGVNIPLQFDRRNAAAEESRARSRQLRAEEARLVDSVRVEVEEARLRLAEAIETAALYRKRLLPASRDQLSAARIGFETGRTTFFQLLDAERRLRDVELRAHTALADLYRRAAELNRAVGNLPSFGVQP